MIKVSRISTALGCAAMCALGIAGCVTPRATEPTPGAGTSLSASAGIGKKTQFVLDCYARVDKDGDKTVFADCFTPDYTMTGPETKMLSKDGSLHGEAAINAMGAMNRNDDASFGKKDWTLVMSMENDNTVVRRMHWTGKAPHGNYAGFEDLPNDLTIIGDAVQIDTFRDGRITDQFFVYDTMGFFMDLAQGDMKKVGAALVKMGDITAAQKTPS